MKPRYQFVWGDRDWLVWESVFPVGGRFHRVSIRRAALWGAR